MDETDCELATDCDETLALDEESACVNDKTLSFVFVRARAVRLTPVSSPLIKATSDPVDPVESVTTNWTYVSAGTSTFLQGSIVSLLMAIARMKLPTRQRS